MNGFDIARQAQRLAREAEGPAPNRAETEAANFERNVRQFAVLKMQRDVANWIRRWAADVPAEAVQDLHETIGLRRKS